MTDPFATGAPGRMSPLIGVELTAAMSRATLQAMSTWSREMARFIGHRLETDAELQERLSRCTEPGEAIEAWSNFMQTAMNEYADEARRLQDLSAESATEAMATMEAEANPNTPPPIE